MAFSFLNSRIFPTSESTADLNASTQSLTYNHRNAATSLTVPLRNQTQISLLERPDDAITALPAQEIPEETQDDQAHEYAASEPPQGNAKKSRWSRIKEAAKAKWNSIRKKNKRELVIGAPTDFKRVGGSELLLSPRPQGPHHGEKDQWDIIKE
jgi:hypothetical protein